jgi:hypothetical protein
MNPLLIEEMLASLGGFGGAAAEAATATKATSGELNDLQKATKATAGSQKSLNEQNIKAIGVIQELYDSMKILQEGATKYNGLLKEFGEGSVKFAAGAAAAMVTITTGNIAGAAMLATAIKGLGSIYTDFAQDSLKQHDLLVKSYQSLSAFGAIDSSGLRGLLTTIEDIGSSPENVQFFIEAMGKASEELVMFGGTVNGGALGVAEVVRKLTNRNAEFEAQLTQMGYTTQDLTKYTTNYISTLSRSARVSVNDTEALKKQSFDYMVVMQELAALTGVSRDKQQAEIDEQQKDIQFRMYLRKLSKEENGAEKVMRANQLIASIQDKASQSAMKQALATGGGVMSMTGAIQADIIRKSYGTAKEVINGTRGVTEGIVAINKDIGIKTEKRLDFLADTIAHGGKEAADAFLITSNTIDSVNKSASMNVEKTKNNTAAAMALQDANLKEEAKRLQNERIVSNYYQELYFAVGKYAVPATTMLAEAAVMAAKGLSKLYNNSPVLDEVAKRETFAEYDFEKNQKSQKEDDSKPWSDPNHPFYEQQQEQQEQMRNSEEQINKRRQQREDVLRSERQEADAKAKAMRDEIARQEKELQKMRSGSSASSNDALKQVTETQLAKIAADFKKLYPDAKVTSTSGGSHMPGSKHYEGRAMDIAFSKKLSDEEFAKVKKELEKLGASKVLNEMERPKGPAGKNWSGAHIHVEVPEAPRTLTPRQGAMVTPSYQEDPNKSSTATAAVSNKPASQSTIIDNSVMVSKLDDLYRLFDRSLRVQEDILTHTKMLA